MHLWLFWGYLIQSWPFSSLRQQFQNKYYNIPLVIKWERWEYSLEFFPSKVSALSCTHKLWSTLEVVKYALFWQVWFNGEGDFWTYSVEMPVFSSPTGYMLTSFGFPFANLSYILKWLVFFLKSSTSTGYFSNSTSTLSVTLVNIMLSVTYYLELQNDISVYYWCNGVNVL